MNIVLISIHYPPIISSCAQQMQDLALELKKKGHSPTIITSNPEAKKFYNENFLNGIKVVTIKGFRIKGNYNYFFRGINDLVTPILMLILLFLNRFNFRLFKVIIWYSPSIFFSPLVYFIKKFSKAKTYLILRDHYPEDLKNIGILKSKIIFNLFRQFNKFQFKIADKIGVQSKNSKDYLKKYKIQKEKIEVLYNWSKNDNNISYSCLDTITNDKKVLLFLGSMSISQYNKLVYKIINHFKSIQNIVILFVGTGSGLAEVKEFISKEDIKNVFIYNQIQPEYVKSLCEKCCAGLIFLNKNFDSHNIPGKFVSYLRAGLPVIADINDKSDLANLINDFKLGIVNTTMEYDEFLLKIESLIKNDKKMNEISINCINFYNQNFTVDKKLDQILKALNET